MKYRVYFFIAFLFVVVTGCAQVTAGVTATWYSPWENNIKDLIKLDPTDPVPLLRNGINYRIIELSNNSNQEENIASAVVTSKNVQVQVNSLPIINNYNKSSILDLVMPISTPIVVKKGETAYFLLKFYGLNSGTEVVRVTFKNRIGKSICSVSKSTVTSDYTYKPSLNLNVWSYFNYSLMKGVKSKAISDLSDHGANVLAIPPSGMPSTSSVNPNGSILENYLSGTKGKFDFYLLFLNYKIYDENNYVLSDKWKDRFPKWLSTVKATFIKCGIPFSKVLIYPYDEPTPDEAANFVKMYNWCINAGIEIPFFVTIGNKNVAYLARYAKVVQSYAKSDLIGEIKKNLGSKSSLWLYEIKANSRNISAFKYLDFGWRASLYGATGIGVWNYADIGKSISAPSMNSILSSSGVGSWQKAVINSSKDYSLVYRRGNQLFSSLRWDALSMGMQDHCFIELYEKKYGSAKAKSLVSSLLNKTLSLQNWEKSKLDLCKSY